LRQAVSKSTGRTVSDPAKASNHRRNTPLFTSLWDEAYIGSGENGKRYRRHHPASSQMNSLPVLILTISNYQSWPAVHKSDYNNGATLIRAQPCVHVFPSNLQFGEADGDAPV
jgi:hypothetical protein